MWLLMLTPGLLDDGLLAGHDGLAALVPVLLPVLSPVLPASPATVYTVAQLLALPVHPVQLGLGMAPQVMEVVMLFHLFHLPR